MPCAKTTASRLPSHREPGSVDQWGNLTVDFWGIDSYAANTFPQPTDPASLIMSFTIDVPEPASLSVLAVGILGLAGLRQRRDCSLTRR